MLRQTDYAHSPCTQSTFSLMHPERVTRALEHSGVALARLGIPGTQDYTHYIHGFLDGFAAAGHKPPVGFVSHDYAHTEHVIREWLDDSPNAHAIPDNLLHVIDARVHLSPQRLQGALDVLTGLLQKQPQDAIPLQNVSVRTLHPEFGRAR